MYSERHTAERSIQEHFATHVACTYQKYVFEGLTNIRANVCFFGTKFCSFFRRRDCLLDHSFFLRTVINYLSALTFEVGNVACGHSRKQHAAIPLDEFPSPFFSQRKGEGGTHNRRCGVGKTSSTPFHGHIALHLRSSRCRENRLMGCGLKCHPSEGVHFVTTRVIRYT